jgi:uncharacterized protein (DUF1499 family)
LPLIGSGEASWERARKAILATGGSILDQEDGYLRATYTTRIFRFVDDVELRLDADQKVIHLRSASRVGSSDLGLNRKRMASLRVFYQQPGPPGIKGTER